MVWADFKRPQIVTNQMRWEGKDKTIPSMGSSVTVLKLVSVAVPTARRFVHVFYFLPRSTKLVKSTTGKKNRLQQALALHIRQRRLER